MCSAILSLYVLSVQVQSGFPEALHTQACAYSHDQHLNFPAMTDMEQTKFQDGT